jgi:hypothetical protein
MSLTRHCGNNKANEDINKAFAYLNEQDRRTLTKRFAEYGDANPQFGHTFWELIAAVQVARLGYAPFYERKLGRKKQTPDWYFDGGARLPSFFAEVVNFHPDNKTEDDQNVALEARGAWVGFLPSQELRLDSSLVKKAGTYKDLAEEIGLPYVVFIYTMFHAAIDPAEVEACLSGPDGLFPRYSSLAGVCHFYQKAPAGGRLFDLCGHQFDWYANPHATRKDFSLPCGFLPSEIPPPGRP